MFLVGLHLISWSLFILYSLPDGNADWPLQFQRQNSLQGCKKNYPYTEISEGRVSLAYLTDELKKATDSLTTVIPSTPKYSYLWLQAPGCAVLSKEKISYRVALQRYYSISGIVFLLSSLRLSYWPSFFCSNLESVHLLLLGGMNFHILVDLYGFPVN